MFARTEGGGVEDGPIGSAITLKLWVCSLNQRIEIPEFREKDGLLELDTILNRLREKENGD